MTKDEVLKAFAEGTGCWILQKHGTTGMPDIRYVYIASIHRHPADSGGYFNGGYKPASLEKIAVKLHHIEPEEIEICNVFATKEEAHQASAEMCRDMIYKLRRETGYLTAALAEHNKNATQETKLLEEKSLNDIMEIMNPKGPLTMKPKSPRIV